MNIEAPIRDRRDPTTVSLISFTDDIYCIGPRRIAAQLKRHGFRVNLIFLRATDFWGQTRQRFQKHFYNADLPESVYAQLFEICRGSSIIGLSVWTHQAEQATLVTRRLQQELGVPVVWGGIHPTSYPEDAVQVADGICMGEGESSFLHVVEAIRDGADYLRTAGFWFRDGDRILRNPGESLIEDLDGLPFMDFEFEQHYVNDQGTLKRMDMALMKKYYGAKLWTMFSQGCPYKCTFCSNDVLIGLDQGYRRFRKHSAAFFMAEVDYILSRYPHIHNVVIDDDAFMFLPLPVIQEFAAAYKARFAIPFFVTGVIPASVEERKFEALIDAGMIKLRIGVQSGNTRIMKEVFVRPLHDDKIFAGSRIVNKHRAHMAPVQYDLIVDNPWEQPEELKDTLRLVAGLKPPYTFTVNSLTLLPGTTIHKMGEEAGFTDPDKKITLASYVTYMPTELNLTLAFYNIAPVPKFWLRRVLKRDYGERTVTMKQYPLAGALISAAGLVKKIVHGVARKDISAIPRPLDLLAGKLFVRRSRVPSPVPAAFQHCLPTFVAPQLQPLSRRAASASSVDALRVL
jgi:anaerobic magnesium-protoporphyrin IX monomethyl ester cyclase